jgi:hypothetical protein
MNSLFDNARTLFASGGIRWIPNGDSIRVFLLTDAYTPDLTNHKFLSDVPSNCRKGNNGNGNISDAILLTLKTPTAGYCSAENIRVTAPPPGLNIDYVLFFKDSGDENTSELIGFMGEGSGLPFLTNGGDIDIEWASSRLFRI